jgi:ribosomal-protein-alanine N-acetyltransferase
MAASDLDQVIEIAKRLEQAPHWPRAAYEAVFDPTKPRRIARVAEKPDGGLAGFAIALVTSPSAELETIAAAEDFQRRGIARQLFEGIAAAARRLEVTDFVLEVRASNAAALGFYRALGFEENGGRRAYYADPTEDALLMRLGVG